MQSSDMGKTTGLLGFEKFIIQGPSEGTPG